jgi:hypothetical protein
MLNQDGVKEMPIVPLDKMEWLVGRVLTQVEAVLPNNPALVKLIKQDMWGWYKELPGYTTILVSKTYKCKEGEFCDVCAVSFANPVESFDSDGTPVVGEIPQE